MLAGLLWAGAHPVWQLLMVATVGNVLGSVVNWIYGRYLSHFADRRWFPVPAKQIERASCWYRKWGLWSLLGSSLPIVGDLLTLVAGLLKEPFWRSVLIVIFAKGGRYIVLAIATLKYA